MVYEHALVLRSWKLTFIPSTIPVIDLKIIIIIIIIIIIMVLIRRRERLS